MEEVAGTAKLVDTAAVGTGNALTATLPRSDIEAALQDDAGADLFLEIARIQNGERNDRRIKVEWSREDLEKLLQSSSGDTVSCTFDADELERMLNDPDFEAHGIKEKAAVVTVAVAAAFAATGGAAYAQTSIDGGSTPGSRGSLRHGDRQRVGRRSRCGHGLRHRRVERGRGDAGRHGHQLRHGHDLGWPARRRDGVLDGRIDQRPDGRDLRPRHRHRRRGHAESRGAERRRRDLHA